MQTSYKHNRFYKGLARFTTDRTLTGGPLPVGSGKCLFNCFKGRRLKNVVFGVCPAEYWGQCLCALCMYTHFLLVGEAQAMMGDCPSKSS